MCADHNKKQKKTHNQVAIYLVMILFGIFSGFSGIEFLENLGLVISDIFIKIFKCVSLPIITLSIIVAISGAASEEATKKMWQRALFYTITTTIIAASLSAIFYLILKPNNFDSALQDTTSAIANQTPYLKHLSNQIPDNILSPFLNYQVIGVLIIGVTIGIAIRYIPGDEPRKLMIGFFKGIHGIFIVVTGWIVAIIPIAIYGFITTTIVQLGKGFNIEGIGKYFAVVILANLVQGFIILPAWLKFQGISPIQSAKGMSRALSIAFFTKSSAGTLPVTIECAEKNLKINPKITRFVLPLCTTINMNGCAAYIFATVIYLMQNNGAEITLATMAIWIVIATIAAAGNAGVPMGCFFLSASLLVSMNVPIGLMGIILPFYTVIDMIETALNVWSDSCVANVVNKKSELESIG
jgi:Na+/H+-dicarboxylate symporter